MSTDYSHIKERTSNRLERFGEDLISALLYPFRSPLSAVLALVIGTITFVVLILAAQPVGVFKEIVRDPVYNLVESTYVIDMFMINFSVILDFYGWTPIVLNGVTGLLTGIALTNMIAQLRMIRLGSLANIGGIVPSLFAAGCASCGPGLFALLGFTGAVSFIPAQDMVLRIVGLGLFLFFLGLSGDPRECRID